MTFDPSTEAFEICPSGTENLDDPQAFGHDDDGDDRPDIVFLNAAE